MNTDKPSGTGDHEHYFYYYGDVNNDRVVYDSNGMKYTNCVKKAIQVREKETGIHWWSLTNNFTLEWMANSEMHCNSCLFQKYFKITKIDKIKKN